MASETEKQEYKNSLKATSLFGGVQVYNIIITILKSKVVALLLGPGGMGIYGLLTSTTGLITSATNFGLATSAVKDIAGANASGDMKRVSRTITVFRRWVWVTGLLGMLVCLGLSSFWSQLTFGNKDYTVAFSVLSLSLLFTQLSSGQIALLQGMRKYSFMAKSSVLGSSAGFLLTLPLYYFWGIDAIVPVIVLSSLASLVLSWYFSRKVQTEPVRLNWRETVEGGKGMVKMGFFIALQGLLAVGAAYIVRLYIRSEGGVDEVGLYTAGFAIINTYVGLVFTAISSEYYPRLAGFCNDPDKFNQAVNQEIEISLLLLGPIILVFIVFANVAIALLYSNKFLGIDGMLYWAILGIFFKAPSWCLAFSFIAKGDTKAYFWSELTAIAYTTALNILFYRYGGLTGMGISFLACYLLYYIQMWLICRYRYGYRAFSSIWPLFFPNLILGIVCLCLVVFISDFVRYGAGSLIVMVSLVLSYRGLDSSIGIRHILKSKFGKNE